MATKLLSPVTLGPLSLPNRVVLAPMTRGRATRPAHTANPTISQYYTQRASAGLLVTEGVFISEQARGWVGVPGIHTADQIASWAPVTQSVHDAGGRIFCQLWHTGRASHSSFREGWEDPRPVAPSAVAVEGHRLSHTPKGKAEYEVPRALEEREIAGVVQEFKRAAEGAKEAGFDGVEIHGANGYLIDTFLQSHTNLRTDKYGGSPENRFRFLDEVIRAVLTVFPASSVGVRISPNGLYNGMGCEDFRELFLYYARRIAEYDLGYLHVVIGTTFGFHGKGAGPMVMSEFREVYKGVMIANQGYTQETADAEIASGGADMVAFGQPFITNPDLVRRFREGIELASWEDEAPTFYSPPEGDLGARGYTDYPFAS